MAMRDEAVITAILTNPTIKAAAASLNCSESAIYKRLKEPKFKTALSKRRSMLLEEAMNVLQSRMLEAVEIISGIMNNTEAPPQTRLNAAESLLRNSLKLSELVSEENEQNKGLFDDLYFNL